MSVNVTCDSCARTAPAAQREIGGWDLPSGWTERNNNDQPGGWRADEGYKCLGVYCSETCKAEARERANQPRREPDVFNFDEMVFLGSGQASVEWRRQIHERLDSGLDLLGGLQQPCHSESEAVAEENRRAHEAGRIELSKIARDLVRALTGEEFLFVGERRSKMTS